MKTVTILRAIEALKKANGALMKGDLSIEAEVNLGSECFSAAWLLEHELTDDIPAVSVKGEGE